MDLKNNPTGMRKSVRPYHRRRSWLILFALLVTLAGMPALGAGPAFALPPDPIAKMLNPDQPETTGSIPAPRGAQ